MKKPVKIVLGIVAVLILGSAIGIGSAVLIFEGIGNSLNTKNGAWGTNLMAGNQQADIYTRARIAVHGLLALNKSETIYFRAYTDDSGQSLDGDYDYRIEGKAPDARWWCIIVYGADDFLVPNDQNRYSYSSDTVSYDPNGNFTIYVSRTQKLGNWLPLGDQKTFHLSLKLYNPGELIQRNTSTVELPHIIKEANK